jgi:hypothetical protein
MYLLTQEELDDLKRQRREEIHLSKSKLQKLCTKIADTMPIVWGWGEPKDEPRPWGCIKSKEYEWYCDQCPVQEICPLEYKHWSK